jgi:pilus assembly protein Flp/PilA
MPVRSFFNPRRGRPQDARNPGRSPIYSRFIESVRRVWDDAHTRAIILLFDKEASMFRTQKKGQGLVEYALILVLVAIVIIIILSVLGPAIGNVFSQIIVNI